jgi:ASC-1-like (ASCH) protein
MQNNNSIYKNKYIKYKQKYLDLKMHGGMEMVQNFTQGITESGTSKYTYSDFKRDFLPSNIIINYDSTNYNITIRYDNTKNIFYFKSLSKSASTQNNDIIEFLELELDNINLSNLDKDNTDNIIIYILNLLNKYILSSTIIINNISKLIYNNKTLKIKINDMIMRLIDMIKASSTTNIDDILIQYFNSLEGIQYVYSDGTSIIYAPNGKENINLPTDISLDEHGNFMKGNEVIMYSKNLVEPWYTQIKEGNKTIEGREFKNDWKCMNVGDYINFYVIDVNNNRHNIFVQIVNIQNIKFGEIGKTLVKNNKTSALFGNKSSCINNQNDSIDVQKFSYYIYNIWNSIGNNSDFCLITIQKVDLSNDTSISHDIQSIISSLEKHYFIE